MNMITPESRRRLQNVFRRIHGRSSDEAKQVVDQTISRVTGPGGTTIVYKAIPPLNGDVTGPIGSTTVVKLQGQPISATDPTEGQILGLIGGIATWIAQRLAGHVIQDEGVPITQRASLDFQGTGVTVTDVSTGGGKTVVTIPGIEPVTHSGDVTGPSTATVVGKIQGFAVTTTDPTDGDILIYDQDLGKYVLVNLSTFTAPTTRWEPVTNGDPDSPEIIFDASGDVVMAEVPI
jgi:hypothetical protein